MEDVMYAIVVVTCAIYFGYLYNKKKEEENEKKAREKKAEEEQKILSTVRENKSQYRHLMESRGDAAIEELERLYQKFENLERASGRAVSEWANSITVGPVGRTKNPYVAGGVASALGGPGLGAYAAFKTEERNKEIRASQSGWEYKVVLEEMNRKEMHKIQSEQLETAITILKYVGEWPLPQ